MLAAIGDGAVCTINALSPSVHSGEAATNYGRKGHIAGSRNVPYAALLNADGTYRTDDELRALFDAVGALTRPRVICYCGGGISATMDALALTRLGHPAVAVYDGSMSEWSRDPADADGGWAPSHDQRAGSMRHRRADRAADAE